MKKKKKNARRTHGVQALGAFKGGRKKGREFQGKKQTLLFVLFTLRGRATGIKRIGKKEYSRKDTHSLPHKFYKISTKLGEHTEQLRGEGSREKKKKTRKAQNAARRTKKKKKKERNKKDEEEKNNCSRFPSVFVFLFLIILVFFLICISYCLFV